MIVYLSLTTLEFAKQSEPELIRITKMPGVLVAMGYWLTSQNASVLGILPRTSIPGLIDCITIFPNEIDTYKNKKS